MSENGKEFKCRVSIEFDHIYSTVPGVPHEVRSRKKDVRISCDFSALIDPPYR